MAAKSQFWDLLGIGTPAWTDFSHHQSSWMPIYAGSLIISLMLACTHGCASQSRFLAFAATSLVLFTTRTVDHLDATVWYGTQCHRYGLQSWFTKSRPISEDLGLIARRPRPWRSGLSSMLPFSSCNRTWITSRSSHILEATCQAMATQSPTYGSGSEKLHTLFQLLRTIWSSTTINLNVKLRLYTAIVIPMTIFACETWKRTAMVVHRLDDLHRRCIRAILSISWRDHVINEEVMRRAGMGVSKALLQQGEGKWLATFSDGSQKDQPIQLGTGCQNTAEESWEAKEDMAEYIPRRLERDGCQLAWGPPDRQWPWWMEASRRPMLREEQADLSPK